MSSGRHHVIREPRNDMQSATARAAEQLMLLCFPLLLADTVRRAHPMSPHPFQLLQADGGGLAPGLAEEDPRVVAASAWIDLAQQPAMLRLPPTQGRYYNLTLFDTAGEPFARYGSLNGDEAGLELVLIGPRWRGALAGDPTAQRAPSQSVWAVTRIHAHSIEDRPKAVAIAKQQSVAWLSPAVQDRQLPRDFEPPPSPCLRRASTIDGATFFHRIDSLLEHAPASYQRRLRPKVASLKSELSAPAKSADWSATFAHAFALGVTEGLATIRMAATASSAAKGRGWRIANLPDHARGTLARAVRAYRGMGARVREDLLSFVCERDESGRPLTGADVYRIRFPRGGLPPAREHWRLAAKPAPRGDHQFVSSDRGQATLDSSGPLEVIVGGSAPRDSRTADWLPAPSGGFSLVMRLFWPRPEALTGAWSMPPVERLESAWGFGLPRAPESLSQSHAR
jgi:hypothetical protein